MVNCGAAMYAAPVGIVNAADPERRLPRGHRDLQRHQTSYGLEAAGVMAACIAEALSPTSTVDSIISTALRLANEGTRGAIAAVVDRATTLSDWREAIAPLRDAIRPHDGAADDFLDRGNRSNDLATEPPPQH